MKQVLKEQGNTYYGIIASSHSHSNNHVKKSTNECSGFTIKELNWLRRSAKRENVQHS